MAFPKENLHEELKKQVEAIAPSMRKLNFVGGVTGPYWDEFSHRASGVTVAVVPVRDRGSYGYCCGFKLKLTRGYYSRHSRKNAVMVKIDNMDAVKACVLDSLKHHRDKRNYDRIKRNFKVTLEKTLPRLFPGRDASVYEGSDGDLYVSMLGHENKPSVTFSISTNGLIGKVEIGYSGKDLAAVAKLLEAS